MRLSETCRTSTLGISFNLSLSALVVTCALLSGCTKEEARESAPMPPLVEVSPSPKDASAALPAESREAQEVINRVFKDAAVLDTSRNPNFVTGDFNGDESLDIALVLKPSTGQVARLNEEYPPWILKDPFVSIQPGMPPLRVTENETLLAVVHGYGSKGWRDPQATQTFLLKNAVGPSVQSQTKTEFLNANKDRKVPKLSGDLIGEVLKGKSGYLYYSGASYVWYDPSSFKGEPEKRIVHPGSMAKPPERQPGFLKR